MKMPKTRKKPDSAMAIVKALAKIPTERNCGYDFLKEGYRSKAGAVIMRARRLLHKDQDGKAKPLDIHDPPRRGVH